MDKLTMAHEYAIEMAKQGIPLKSCLELGWKYADAMQAEADKRNKAEAAQKRKEIREMLNADNTFIEREGQHFDDLTPTWDQGPNVLTAEDSEKYKNMIKREFVLYNNPPPKIEKRKSIHEEESDWQPDWSQAPEWANYIAVYSDYCNAGYFEKEPKIISGYTWGGTDGKSLLAPIPVYAGNWQDSLRKRPEALCEVDWNQAPDDAIGWVMMQNYSYWNAGEGYLIEEAPPFGFTGTHIVERPHGF